MIEPRITAIHGKSDDNVQFTIEPFDRGYSRMIGLMLRKILMSSITGTAITEASIDGVHHCYSSVPGVAEDVISIITNLRKIAFKTELASIYLSVRQKGPKIVCAGDIITNADCKIMNPEVIICHVQEGSLGIQLRVERGRGLINYEKHLNYRTKTLITNAQFSPVERVSFETVDIKNHLRGISERLILEVKTNKTVTALEALIQSVRIAKNQFTISEIINSETPIRP